VNISGGLKIKLRLKPSFLGKIALILILLVTPLFTACCSGALGVGWAGTLVVDDTLYVATMQGELSAYDLTNARAPLWTLTLGNGAALYGPPVVSGDYIYIGTASGVVYKLKSDNTEAARTIDLGSPIVGGVAVGLDMVFVGTSEGIFYALDADDLSQEWRYPEVGKLSDRIWGTPTVDVTGADTAVVYFGAFDHKLYALDQDGEEVWTSPFEAGGAIASKPLVYNGVVYFGAFDRKFYALDQTDGSAAWTSPFAGGNWFWTEAIVYDNTDNDTADGTIFVGCLDHNVYALDPVTGAQKGKYTIDGPITAPPVIAVLPGENKSLGDTDDSDGVQTLDDDDVEMLIVASGASTGSVYALDPANLAGTPKWASPFTMNEQVQSPMSVHIKIDGDLVYQFLYVYGRGSTLTARWLTTGGDSGWDIKTSE